MAATDLTTSNGNGNRIETNRAAVRGIHQDERVAWLIAIDVKLQGLTNVVRNGFDQLHQAVRDGFDALPRRLADALPESAGGTSTGGGGGGVGSLVIGSPRPALEKILRSATDWQNRLDYAGRSDSNPVYVGKQKQGHPTSADDWHIQKLVWDGSGRLIHVQVLTGAWDQRDTLAWE